MSESPAETRGRPPRLGLMATDAMRVLGLRTILGDGETVEIVLIDGPRDERLDRADRTEDEVEVVLVDTPVSRSLFDLLATFRRARPHIRLLVLGEQTDFDHVERVIGAGAKGYLSHAASESELRTAIDVVRDGSVWAPRKVMARLVESSLSEPGTLLGEVQFTKREREVLRLLIQGQPNRQIASTLGVDEGTIKAHMGRLMRKAGVDNRTALSMRAIEREWAG